VWSDRRLLTFQRCFLPPLSGFYRTTRRENTEKSYLHVRRSEPEITFRNAHWKERERKNIGWKKWVNELIKQIRRSKVQKRKERIQVNQECKKRI
jgi:hypothetical protein